MVDLARRNFFKAKSIHTKPAIRLPYVANEDTFIENCTQCARCITSCPENIIIKGDAGFPEIDFARGECTFCNKCIDVCDEPLFNHVDSAPAFDLHIQIKGNCLAVNQVFCQSCQDSCDTEAISFRYLDSSIPQPQILLDSCNGCGACVSVCPQASIELSPHTTLTKVGEINECS